MKLYVRILIVQIAFLIITGNDSVTAMKRIRELHLKPVIIITLTANAMTGDEETYINKGFDGYISKPFNLELLRETVAKYIKS